ncbi:MAG: hypothetical protein R3A52_23880 [Polyangiales bacterium]
MTLVRRELHHQLPARLHQREQPRDQRFVVVDPLDRRVGEDQVPLALEGREVARGEAQPVARVGAGLREHLAGAVDPGDVAVGERVGEAEGELSGAASEVDGGDALALRDQGQGVVEGRGALALKAVVLLRIPGHRWSLLSGADD